MRKRSREDICSKMCSPSTGYWVGKVHMVMSTRACVGQRSEVKRERPGGGDWSGALNTTSPVLSLTHPPTPPLCQENLVPRLEITIRWGNRVLRQDVAHAR